MERGLQTRGKVAQATSGAEAIEIKAVIPSRQVTRALRRFGLQDSNDDERYIYFFDTPQLSLHREGIITRARRVIGDQHDSTVKFRPVVPQEVGKRWRRYAGFKIEADVSEKGLVKSASFSMPVSKGAIKEVVAGRKAVKSIFTREQEAFMQEFAGRKITFDRLVVLGPLLAQRWRFDDPGCPWPITAELWKRADGRRMMELSIKSPVVQAAAAIGGFMAFLAEVGAERDQSQQTKTRWALDYYAAALKKAAPPKAAPVKKK
jgi:hypothetical protein